MISRLKLSQKGQLQVCAPSIPEIQQGTCRRQLRVFGVQTGSFQNKQSHLSHSKLDQEEIHS